MEARPLSRPGVFAPRSRRLLGALGDDRLVEQLRRGNDAAFEAIYDRHHSGLLAFCRHMLGSREEAEDALQQVFVSAHDSLRRDARPVALKAWLYTVARNRCLTMLRARREQSSEPGEIATAGLSEQVESRAELRELLADLAELPEAQRSALVLFELGDLSQPEVAEVLGVDSGKVKALVFQARSSLTEMRNARAIPCTEIREQLATARGGVLRRGPLRRHLRGCAGCTAFRDEVRTQRAALAIVLPVIPTLGLRDTALAAVGLGGGGGAAGGGGLIAGLAAKGVAAKTIAATVATTAVVGGGAVVTDPPAFLGGGDEPRAGAAATGAGPAGPARVPASPGEGGLVTAASAGLAVGKAKAALAEQRREDRERERERERERGQSYERREEARLKQEQRGGGKPGADGRPDRGGNRGGKKKSDPDGTGIEIPLRPPEVGSQGRGGGAGKLPEGLPRLPLEPPAGSKAKGKGPAAAPDAAPPVP